MLSIKPLNGVTTTFTWLTSNGWINLVSTIVLTAWVNQNTVCAKNRSGNNGGMNNVE